MTHVVIPSAEVAAVLWAKADPDLNALLAGRVATRLPTENTESILALGFLRVVRVGGARWRSEPPIDGALLQWDAYAARKGDQPDYATAELIARTLVAKAEVASGVKVGDAWIYTMVPTIGPRRQDEPDTGWARFQVDTTFTFRKS